MTADRRDPAMVERHARLDRLRDQIFELGLERNVVELELYGYTIIKNVQPMAFFDELRETILDLEQEDIDNGGRIPLAGPDGNSSIVIRLLSRGRIFEQAIMSAKPLTLVTYLLGESCQISSNHAHIRAQGDPPQGLHQDNTFVPEPLPAYHHACNMMWCLDDFAEEAGGTYVVPGSHKRLFYPTPESIQQNAIAVDARRGDVFVFTGNLWHAAGARKLPGKRIGMTCYFSRMYARQQEPLAEIISDEIVERNPPRFAQLIGRYNPYPFGAQPQGKFGYYEGLTGDPRG